MVRLTVPSLPVGATLPALDLTDRGEVSRISIYAFSAGRVVPAVAERLAAAAEKGGRPASADAAGNGCS